MNPINSQTFGTVSLRSTKWVDPIKRITKAALMAVNPRDAVNRVIQRKGTKLIIADREYNLDNLRKVFVVGAGKASVPMGCAVAEILDQDLAEGMLITKEGHSFADRSQIPAKLDVLEAGHPLPDERGVKATHQVIQMLKRTKANDLVICLISGGGSALLIAPAVDIRLQDLRTLTAHLLACGATITEINILRKHLSQVKGGNLARLAAPAFLSTLILSDVVGDPLDVIASGPTVPDSSTYQDAIQVLKKFAILEGTPTSISNHLRRGIAGEIPETPKSRDNVFDRTQNLIIGNNYLAARAATRQAQAEGYNTLLLTTFLQGEAREAGLFLSSLARQIAETNQPISRPACVIVGGETTVTIRGDGLGGRNLELALSAVRSLSGIPDLALITLATDGGDGPTDAAGAVVTGDSFSHAADLGLEPEIFLTANDSYNFFDPLGDLIKTGPTQTNVNDLIFIFLQ